MFTSVTDKKQRRCLTATVVYAAVSLFCALFGIVYTVNGHEIFSPFMSFMFLVPLSCAALFLIFGLTGAHRIVCRVGFNLWNSGIAVLTVAATLTGVYNIAGVTVSRFIPLYLFCGASLLAAGAAVCCVFAVKSKRHR